MNVPCVFTAFRSGAISLIRYMARLLMVSGFMLLMIVSLLIVSAVARLVREGIPAISPNMQAIVLPVTMLSIFSGAFYFNIRRARKRVSHWKPGSSYWFVRSNGLLGVKVRARRVWMKELGYEEREALTIAGYQERAIVMTFVGVITLFTVLANLVGS